MLRIQIPLDPCHYALRINIHIRIRILSIRIRILCIRLRIIHIQIGIITYTYTLYISISKYVPTLYLAFFMSIENK